MVRQEDVLRVEQVLDVGRLDAIDDPVAQRQQFGRGPGAESLGLGL